MGTYPISKDVEIFHDYCLAKKLHVIPMKHSKRLREEEDGQTMRTKLKRFERNR